jgi:hypothetical protein
MAQETFDDPQAQPPLHPALPAIGTFAPAVIASQAGDPALDACTSALAAPPGARVLQRPAFLRERALGRDGHPLDARSGERGLRLRRVDPTISSQRVGGMLEDLLVVLHRLNGLPMLMGMFQDLIARDDATLHFIKDDVATELDLGAANVSGNSAGV